VHPEDEGGGFIGGSVGVDEHDGDVVANGCPYCVCNDGGGEGAVAFSGGGAQELNSG